MSTTTEILEGSLVNIAKPKKKKHFPSNEALLKMLYKTTMNVTRKWTECI